MLLNANQETDDLVAQALAAIRSVLEPQHVVLFGSTRPVAPIRRTHSAQTDLDLLIVAPSPFPDGLIHLAIWLGVRTVRANSLPELSRSSGEANQLLRAAEKDWRPVGQLADLDRLIGLVAETGKDDMTAYLDLGDLNPYAEELRYG